MVAEVGQDSQYTANRYGRENAQSSMIVLPVCLANRNERIPACSFQDVANFLRYFMKMIVGFSISS